MLTDFTVLLTCATTSGRSRMVVGPKKAFSTERFSRGPIPPVHFATRSNAANSTFWRRPARPAVQFINTALPTRSGYVAAKVAPIMPPQELPTKCAFSSPRPSRMSATQRAQSSKLKKSDSAWLPPCPGGSTSTTCRRAMRVWATPCHMSPVISRLGQKTIGEPDPPVCSRSRPRTVSTVCSRSGGPMLVIGTHPIHNSSTQLGNPQQDLRLYSAAALGPLVEETAMYLTTRPMITAAAVLIGVNTVAVTPMAAASPQAEIRGVQLTSFDPNNWLDVLQQALTNTTDIYDHFAPAPFPDLQQFAANLPAYFEGTRDISTDLASAGKAAVVPFEPTNPEPYIYPSLDPASSNIGISALGHHLFDIPLPGKAGLLDLLTNGLQF